jgi:hypothetical protein
MLRYFAAAFIISYYRLRFHYCRFIQRALSPRFHAAAFSLFSPLRMIIFIIFAIAIDAELHYARHAAIRCFAVAS